MTCRATAGAGGAAAVRRRERVRAGAGSSAAAAATTATTAAPLPRRALVLAALAAAAPVAAARRARAEAEGLAEAEEGLAEAEAALAAAQQAAAATAAATGQGADSELDYTEEERLLMEYNERIRSLNGAPADFPTFVRSGYDVRVLAGGYKKSTNGLLYKDFTEGSGRAPTEGEEVRFHYVAYNENGRTIDSTYRSGEPARTRLGIAGLIPGFEEGLLTMRVGGKRRIVVPPELGPPVGPSTFFSAKQWEVFDIELLEVKKCERKTKAGGLVSSIVCE